MSYKVFLVEDEVVVRESIRENVPWAQTPFLLAGEASDGEMALPLIEDIKPDILITDIKMPFMDGLELARIVRRNLPWIKIIIISGYDEFAFAREAISISVTDYLLKPLSSADLLETLGRVARQIEAETAEREKLQGSAHLMAERFLNDLATGLVPSAEAIDRARLFGLNLRGRCFMVAVVRPIARPLDSVHQAYAEHLKAENLIGNLLQGNEEVLKFSRSLREIVLIFRGEDPFELEKHCYAVCHSLKYEVERKTGCLLAISIGSVRERIQGIAESLAEAEMARGFDYIFGENKVVGIEDARRARFGGVDLMKLDAREIGECLRRGEREKIPELLDAYLSRLTEGQAGSSMYHGFAVLEVALTAAKFVVELGGEVDQVLPEIARLETAASGGVKDAVVYLKRLLEAAFEFREARKRDKYGDLLRRAMEYIDGHFTDPEISLTMVAREAGMSPSHFSMIFSQEAGKTFIEHLTHVRIRRAMELLKTSSLRSSEIAFQVGYKDPHYFSYIFKLKAGCTPTEFRRRDSAPKSSVLA